MRVFIISGYLFSTILGLVNAQIEDPSPQPCESEIYCHGPLLHTLQMAHLEEDSKSFVDMALRFEPGEVLVNFTRFQDQYGENPTKEQVLTFMNANFVDGDEFNKFEPEDWEEEPPFLVGIVDESLKQFGKDLNGIWHDLGRTIKDVVNNRSEMYSMYYVPHPVIVPGGRFKEFYYWDSYWIQKGLLVSGMNQTVKGMIENFVEIVKKIGFIPNGGRIYYQRTQPPLLIPMVDNYYEVTKDISFIRDNIQTLIQEFQFFMVNRTHTFEVHGTNYTMARYNVELQGPRPESYREDYNLTAWLGEFLFSVGAPNDTIEKAQLELNFNLKSGAESGWDFSSRWFVPMPSGHQKGDLFNTRTREIIPVDLNGFLYRCAVLLSKFCELINDAAVCSPVEYTEKADELKTAINAVLWDEESGSWFDYDYVRQELRRAFYPTNLVPLWVKAHRDENVVPQVLKYLNDSGALEFPGGVPTSLIQTGQQWDFPNGWAPLQHIVVEALEYSGNDEAKALAFDLAQRWVQSNHKTFQTTNSTMFEKYDVTTVGNQGGGGEYEVVVGFGWSNGVVLDFLKMYGDRLVSLDPPITDAPITDAPTTEEPPSTTAGSATADITSISFTMLLTYTLIFNEFA